MPTEWSIYAQAGVSDAKLSKIQNEFSLSRFQVWFISNLKISRGRFTTLPNFEIIDYKLFRFSKSHR